MNETRPPLRILNHVINGRYAVIRQIGKGASGEVYLVKDTEKNDTEIALKYLKLEPENQTALEHFKSEFNMMTHLTHPHIARVYDFEWDDDIEFYFFTSEMVTGLDFIKASLRLDIDRTELLFIQSLRALEYLHGHGIYHYDIKPSNLLVQNMESETPSVKMIDFGLASPCSPDKLVGTPSYMAPEMLRREKTDGRADLYSLGVVAYYAFTGINPFRGTTSEETFQNQLNHIPRPPIDVESSVPKHINDIIVKLLAKNPEDRFQSASDVIKDLNLRSERFYSVETSDTLLSYVPWEGPFIGRKAEQTIFKDWLKNINEDEPGRNFFVVSGKLGTGKSRFAEECKNIAQLNGFNTLYTNTLTPKILKKIDKSKFPFLLLFEGFDKYLRSGDKGLLQSLDMSLHKIPIFLTATHENNPTNYIQSYFDKIHPQTFVTSNLFNFVIQEINEYIRTLTGLNEAPKWLTLNLFKFTNGNPLFITETMKYLISIGLLFDQQGRWKKTTLEDFGIDLTLFDISEATKEKLKGYFASFNASEKEVAAIMATWRGEIKKEYLQNLAGETTNECVVNLVERDILRHNSEKLTYSFTSLVLKNAFYNYLSEEARQFYHDKIASFIKEKNLTEENIDFHIERGSNEIHARTALIKYITENKDHPRTFRTLDVFLNRFGDKLDDDVFEMVLLKARKQSTIRNNKGAHDTYKKLMDALLANESRPEWHFRLHLAIGSLLVREKRLVDAISHFKEAKTLLPHLIDPVFTIIVENHLAEVDILMNNYDYAIEKYERTRRETDKLKREDQVKIMNNDLGHAYFQKGEYSKAVDELKDEVKFYRKNDMTAQLVRTLYLLGESLRYLRKFDQAEEAFTELIDLAKVMNDTERLYRAYNGIGNVLSDKSNYGDSIGYFERAFDLALHLNNHDAAVGLMINLAIINSNINNIKKATETFETAIAFINRAKFPISLKDVYLCRSHLELGELYRMQGDFDKASLHLEEALGLARSSQARYLLFWIVLTEAKLARDMKEEKSLKGYVKKAKKLADSADKKRQLEEILR